ncbi:MAG: tetratricopeptide repeat protein [Bacteroidia bacterium]
MKNALLLLFAFVGFSIAGKAQTLEDLNDIAESYMTAGDYERAYNAYDNLAQQNPNNAYYLYRKGECTFHLPARKQEAIDLFKKAYEMEPKEKAILINIGKAYHINYKFDEAISYYNEYLATNPSDAEKKAEAEKLIENSEYGKKTVLTMLEADIRNIGPPINTNEEEYVPVLSADETMLIYTYRGANSTGGLMDEKLRPDSKTGMYYEDIFTSSQPNKNSAWAVPKPIDQLNTKGNDAPIALSADGQTLFTFKSGPNDGGDIYKSSLEGDVWGAPQRITGDVNTKFWEGSCSVSSDGKYLYFSSERPGGLGKRDLYVAEKMADGSYKNVKNLGPSINTKYDEDSPFIHVDGVTLFFSSKGHKSIGDYDIFYTVLKDNTWIDPVNMGYPLNTTDDDRFYVINADGDRGYFSSNRITNGGNGTSDIFTVTPGILGEKPVLAMVLGNIYGNGKPISAQIDVTRKSNGQKIGPFGSNTKTGKYLLALSPGDQYVFNVRAKDYPEQTEELNIEKLTKFVEIRKDFRLTKDNFVDTVKTTKLNEFVPADTSKPAVVTPTVTPTETVAANNPPASPCDAFKTLDFSALKNRSLNDPYIYNKLLEIGDKICSEKMVFKVQIGAYKFPKNFKWDRLKDFGDPEVVAYPDSLTRFTQGSFNNIHAAEKLRQSIIEKGQKDAWIVGFIDGKRYTLEQLIMVDFYNKNVASFEADLQDLKNYLSVK